MNKILRILMVEDSEADAELLVRTLCAGGYDPQYEVVDNSTAMGAALKRQDWDVITSDHSMPLLSALEALALVRNLDPTLPFIIVSGEMNTETVTALIKAGADDYIRKMELDWLVPVVDRVLRERRLQVDQQHTQLELHASETRYRRLFESSGDGILILDAETGQVVEINPSLVEMLGYTREQCIGTPLWEIGAFPDVEACKSSFLALRAKGYIRHENQPLQTRDGRIIDVECISSVYLVDDLPKVQCNIRDNSARVQAEARVRVLNAELDKRVRERTVQLELANQELGTFNCAVAHDLSAPLRRINGFARALEHDHCGEWTPESLNLLRSIRDAARNMDSLIDALLRLARLTRNQLNLKPTSLSAMAEAIMDDLRAGDPERRVEFAAAKGIGANADSGLLHVLLENLLRNAWKFTSRQPVAHVQFGVVPGSSPTAYFVEDDGVGFDMKYAGQLFGAFQRFHDQAEFPGTGIGLASVQRVVHRHGGQIWAESTPGQGAKFYFTLEAFSNSDGTQSPQTALMGKPKKQPASAALKPARRLRAENP